MFRLDLPERNQNVLELLNTVAQVCPNAEDLTLQLDVKHCLGVAGQQLVSSPIFCHKRIKRLRFKMTDKSIRYRVDAAAAVQENGFLDRDFISQMIANLPNLEILDLRERDDAIYHIYTGTDGNLPVQIYSDRIKAGACQVVSSDWCFDLI